MRTLFFTFHFYYVHLSWVKSVAQFASLHIVFSCVYCVYINIRCFDLACDHFLQIICNASYQSV